MVKSAVYQGNTYIGEVEIYPYDSYTGPWIREIRISHFSPPSERCLPLSVLHTVASGGFRFKLELIKQQPRLATEDSPLVALHSACLRENKTAVVPLGEEELHLVAMTSRDNLMHSACFWGFVVPLRLYNCSLAMLNLRCLGIVFDLDETLIVANTMRSFEDRMDALQRKISNEIDPQRIAGMLAELKCYQEDKYILKQYAENDQVVDNGKIFQVQMENVPPLSDSHQSITRPVIRLQEKNIILTRVNPLIRDTSVLVRLRPAWEDLRGYLTARGRKRFEVFVCTMAERDYALEMWRLLDPNSNLIDSTKLLDRLVCVKSGSRKSLLNVFQDGICHPKMALVIDDRVKVWNEKDQPRVHVVPAFAPYYAPQAEENSSIPVLCVARNVACNVRGGFFKDFDDELLPIINGVSYEDDFRHILSAPDVGNYLITEDDTSALNVNKEQPIMDGMADAVAEKRLKETSCGVQVARPIITTLGPKLVSSLQVMASSGGPNLSPLQMMGPTPMNQGPNHATLGCPLGPLAFPEPNFQTSPATEEGEVPESELDPDTRRRLLILQHGQDTRDSTPPSTVFPPLNVSVPPVQPPGTWFQMEELNPMKINKASAKFNLNPEFVHYDNKQPRHPPFFPGNGPLPSDRIIYESRRLPLKLNHGSDAGQRDYVTPNYYSFGGEETQLRRTFSSHKSSQFENALEQTESPVSVLKEIAAKCGAKVEFRSAVCDSIELQFLIEVWFVGEKLGEGVGRTRKEAQHRAAEISLRNLADKYLSNAQYERANLHGGSLKSPQFNQNGYPVVLDQRLDSSSRKSPVTTLKELCIAEGFTLDFLAQQYPSTGSVGEGKVSAEVHIAGQILGQGVGTTWEEAKLQSAEEALGNFRPMLDHIPQKSSSSPRSSMTIPNKRLKPDFPGVLQRNQTSSRYTQSEKHLFLDNRQPSWPSTS